MLDNADDIALGVAIIDEVCSNCHALLRYDIR